MNNKVIFGVIIAVIVIGGGVFLLTRNNSSQIQNTTASIQKQTQSSPVATATTTSGKSVVTIQNVAFSPSTLTVKVGDTVTWTNKDSMGHSATADDNSFDTGVFSPGQSKTVTFNKAGTFTYHCSVHPYMHGTIIVQ